ncbi:MAG TPA: hypothetical protein VF058_11670, partial [Actinomycetota bacterium]
REGCVTVRFRLKVPARSTRYLLLFTEIGNSNEHNIQMARKFNKRTLNRKVLAGISKGARSKIVNWDLT